MFRIGRLLTTYCFGLCCIGLSLALSPYGYAQSDYYGLERVSQFSGKIVPRFESLRANEVNGRVGPSLDHPVRWQYKLAGLPVMVVKETRDWCKVRDPDGAEVWVFNQLLSTRPTAISRFETILRKKPKLNSPAIARVSDSVVMEVKTCTATWCQVTVGSRKGWLARKDIWGATKADPNA